jgi:hypothetical protein
MARPDTTTIVFFPEPGAWGPTNNCVAIADVLSARGHRVVFVVEESFTGVLEQRGFEERVMSMAPAAESSAPGADPWAEFIRITAPEFRRPTIEQQETVTKPIWEALVAGEQFSHERLMAIWEDVRPDVICTDNVTGFPAVELVVDDGDCLRGKICVGSDSDGNCHFFEAFEFFCWKSAVVAKNEHRVFFYFYFSNIFSFWV